MRRGFGFRWLPFKGAMEGFDGGSIRVPGFQEFVLGGWSQKRGFRGLGLRV